MAIKYGLNHVTTLVEEGKAQLVMIAHDVDPIELVLWLPALCKKQGVPYCIVKARAPLAQCTVARFLLCGAPRDCTWPMLCRHTSPCLPEARARVCILFLKCAEQLGVSGAACSRVPITFRERSRCALRASWC